MSAGDARGRPRRKIVFIYNTAQYLLRFRRELMRSMQEAGFETVAMVPATDPAVSGLTDLGVRCIDLPIADKGVTPFRDLKLVAYLVAALKKERPDIVFNFTIKPVIYGSIAARIAGVKKIFSMITGLGYVFSSTKPSTILIRAIVMLQYRLVLRFNTRVFFQNPDDLGHFVRRRLIAEQSCVLINGSGVDLEYFSFTKRYETSRVFLLVARLLWDKGVGEFVQAARLVKKSFPAAEFWLVGPMDTNPAAIRHEQISAWQSEGAIRYFGEVPDVRPLLERATVFVLPSYREGTPRTVLEAMSTGLPVITTDVPGCRQTVEEGVNGFLVPPRDAPALARVMERILSAPGLIAEMGKAARSIAESKYDVRMVNARILEVVNH